MPGVCPRSRRAVRHLGWPVRAGASQAEETRCLARDADVPCLVTTTLAPPHAVQPVNPDAAAPPPRGTAVPRVTAVLLVREDALGRPGSGRRLAGRQYARRRDHPGRPVRRGPRRGRRADPAAGAAGRRRRRRVAAESHRPRRPCSPGSPSWSRGTTGWRRRFPRWSSSVCPRRRSSAVRSTPRSPRSTAGTRQGSRSPRSRRRRNRPRRPSPRRPESDAEAPRRGRGRGGGSRRREADDRPDGGGGRRGGRGRGNEARGRPAGRGRRDRRPG